MTLELDHVVVCVADLGIASRWYEAQYGLSSLAGGRHPGHGTSNRIIPLGDNYIELLAVTDLSEARTSAMGSWVLSKALGYQADAVCVRTDDIASVCRRLGLEATPMERKRPDGVELAWKVAGTELTFESGLPFFIQWEISPEHHPGRSAISHRVKGSSIDVSMSGDPELLEEWLEGVRGVGFAGGDPGVRMTVRGAGS